MPAVPNTWLDDFVANFRTTGTQADPVITVLASGHILILWTDYDDSGVGSPAGSDIIGRIFDSQGNPVTSDIRFNTFNTGDTEFDVSVAALPNGGFTITYDESGAFTDVNVQTYGFDPATNSVSETFSGNLFFDVGDSDPFGTVIAATSSSTALAAYTLANSDGSETVVVRSYDPTTNGFGAATNVFVGASGAGEDLSAPSIAALTSGNFAVAFVNRNSGAANDAVELYVRSNTGAAVFSITVATGAEFTDVSVAAINSGHFVVAYNDLAGNGNITYRVFTNAGVAAGGPFTDANGANSQNEQAVIGLADGTFIIVWDDDTTGQIVGQRYGLSSGGVFAVTGNFVVDDTGGTGISEIELTAFADGRFAVAWSANGDIRTKILDTRDVVNPTAVYTFQNQQVGTIGNDVFTTNDQADLVHGHDGNDVITDGGLSEDNDYFGDDGNDTLIVQTAIVGDSWQGGSGNDTIDWSGSGVVNGTYDLGTGVASLGANSEVMTSFENIIATNTNDTIFGTSGENTINALGGNDIIEGGFSTDTINAGDGNDRIIVREGQFADNVIGGIGVDTYEFDYTTLKVQINLAASTLQVLDAGGTAFGPALSVSGIENVTGGALNDVIVGDGAANRLIGNGGNDDLNGGAGIDRLEGGDGNDIYRIDTGADVIVEAVGLGYDRVLSSSTYTLAAGVSVELVQTTAQTGVGAINFTGNALNQRMEGNNGINVLNGGDGADILVGFSGNDTYYVSSIDQIIEVAGGGTLDRALAAASFTLAVDDDIEYLATTNEAGIGSINLVGNGVAQTIVGNAGINVLNGNGGPDILRGLGGNDIYYVDSSDTIEEGVGQGTLDRALASTTFALAADDNIEYLATTNEAGATAINLLGNSIAQTIVGNAAANTLVGFGGADTLRGLGGSDIFSFRNVSDSGVAAGTRDIIADFDDIDGAAGDRIDLALIDAVTGGANNAFTFIAGAAFTAAGQIRVFTSGGNTIIEGNVGGSLAADFSIQLTGIKTLSSTDFLL